MRDEPEIGMRACLTLRRPGEAGTHFDFLAKARWIPAFAGMTTL
jgi:hypothetical protein